MLMMLQRLSQALRPWQKPLWLLIALSLPLSLVLFGLSPASPSLSFYLALLLLLWGLLLQATIGLFGQRPPHTTSPTRGWQRFTAFIRLTLLRLLALFLLVLSCALLLLSLRLLVSIHS